MPTLMIIVNFFFLGAITFLVYQAEFNLAKQIIRWVRPDHWAQLLLLQVISTLNHITLLILILSVIPSIYTYFLFFAFGILIGGSTTGLSLECKKLGLLS